jgi:hypothetical protein
LVLPSNPNGGQSSLPPGSGGAGGEAGSQAPAAGVVPPADEFKALVAETRSAIDKLSKGYETLKQDFVRHRISAKRGAAAPATSPGEGQEIIDGGEQPRAAPAEGAGRAFAAQTRLTAEIAALPEKEREELLGALDAEEISVEQALDRARWIKKGMGVAAIATPPRVQKPTPPGTPESGPNEPPGPSFATLEDWQKFRRENWTDALKILAKGNFDPLKLPRKNG